MKTLLTIALCLAVISCENNAQNKSEGAGDVDFETKMDSVSYSIGLNIGGSFRQQQIEVDYEKMVAGMKDAIAEKPKFNDEVVQQILMAFQQDMQVKAQERAKVEGEANMKKGKEYLEKNKSKEGVKTTASGLQYKVIKEGTGAQPTAADKVTVHYTGTLIDGKEFDSSVKRGQPATFPLGGVIKGWTEGLQLMKEGGKCMFYIPGELAYGQQAPPEIGPNQTLIFEVELIKVEKGEGTPPPQMQTQPPRGN